MADMDIYKPFDAGAGSSNLEADWRQIARGFVGAGVDMTYANGMQVYGDSSGRQVKVKTGRVWIDGGFYGEITAEKTIALATNTSGNPRIDRIVAQLDPTSNKVTIEVVQGTPAGSPTVPALTQSATGIYQVPLAYMQLANSYTTVASGDVVENRQGAVGQDNSGRVLPWGMAWGYMGATSVTSDQSSTSSSIVDITSATVTVTVPANRRIKVSASARITLAGTTADSIEGYIRESSTTLHVFYRMRWPASGQSNINYRQHDFVVLTPTAGAHTYKLSMLNSTGNSYTTSTQSTEPVRIEVEDIGPAIG